jgi:hypothetical protein
MAQASGWAPPIPPIAAGNHDLPASGDAEVFSHGPGASEAKVS